MVKRKTDNSNRFRGKKSKKLRIVFNPKGIPPMGLVELN